MDASPPLRNSRSSLEALSPSTFGRGSGRGRECEAHKLRAFMSSQSLSPALSQREREFFCDLLRKSGRLMICAVVLLQPITGLAQQQTQTSQNATVTVSF